MRSSFARMAGDSIRARRAFTLLRARGGGDGTRARCGRRDRTDDRPMDLLHVCLRFARERRERASNRARHPRGDVLADAAVSIRRGEVSQQRNLPGVLVRFRLRHAHHRARARERERERERDEEDVVDESTEEDRGRRGDGERLRALNVFPPISIGTSTHARDEVMSHERTHEQYHREPSRQAVKSGDTESQGEITVPVRADVSPPARMPPTANSDTRTPPLRTISTAAPRARTAREPIASIASAHPPSSPARRARPRTRSTRAHRWRSHRGRSSFANDDAVTTLARANAMRFERSVRTARARRV